MLHLAVVGKDVSQSDSPSMHTFILQKLGAKCSYERVSVPPAQFMERAEELFSRFDAFNVTIPFKGEIIPFLKKTEGDARVFGAVNTVVSATRTGYNTDGEGFALMLRNAGVEVAGRTALVLGAGGAGRSCCKKLADGGAVVSVYERDEERLQEVYREIGGFSPLTEIPFAPYDIVVNCTGIGMHDTVGKTPVVAFEGGASEPVGEQLLSLCQTAVDLIYVPAQSEFLRIAASLNKQTVNGAAMLFYQAYYADCIYLRRGTDAAEAKALWDEYRGGKV